MVSLPYMLSQQTTNQPTNMMGKKSRHYRDESDPLLGYYSHQMAASSSSKGNPLYHDTNDYRTTSLRFVEDPHSHPGLCKHDTETTTRTTTSNSMEDPLSPARRRIQQPSKTSHHPPAEEQQHREWSFHSSIREPPRPNAYRVHRVSYTAQNHVQVLFRMYGSAFPQVLPFCLANIVWAILVMHLKQHTSYDLTFHSSIGHSFMGLLVSFLVVSRSKISYDRFMELRRHLAKSYKSCRELVQFATVYTYGTQTPQAVQWRHLLSYRTILLLRITMDALLWSSTERVKWEDEYFKYNIEMDDEDSDDVSEHFFRFRALTHGRRSMIDEAFRAPISFAHDLRFAIMQHPEYLGYKMPVNEYRDLLNFVSNFLDAFHEFRVLIFTPYPFPLVQMTRTFLFFWVYTLPLVLLKEYRFWSSIIIISFVTLGFIGVEYVSMALDDPFGDDTNDVDEHGMALLVYEDIYLAIYRTDGYAAACNLRQSVLERYRQGRGLDCYRDDLKGYEFWERYRPGPPPRPRDRNTERNADGKTSGSAPPMPPV